METRDRLTLEELLTAFDEHLRRTRGVCPATQRNYARFVRAFVRTVFADGPVGVAEIHARDVVEFVAALTCRYRPGTVELAASAFQLFKQGQQGIDRPEGGLGVGLTLVERLVGLHGGTVRAHSEGLGKGSRFVVCLPARMVKDAGSGASGSGEEQSGQEPRRRILVVDDNVDAANALRYLLENDGHEVKVAGDGAAGLALARDFRPDFLLLDIGLPRMNGYEIAKQVREDKTLRNVTIIAITGYGQANDRARTSAAGFDHHLTKPVEFHSLQKLFRVTT